MTAPESQHQGSVDQEESASDRADGASPRISPTSPLNRADATHNPGDEGDDDAILNSLVFDGGPDEEDRA
jgi:hypothetical protein